MKRYAVKSTFGPTLQGEGFNAGRACHFLRFAGCNAWDGRPETKQKSACPYCDTDFIHGVTMSQIEIVSAFRRASRQHGLVITGGEPMLQLDQPLLDVLTGMFDWIDIETNGTVAPKFKRAGSVSISCSPKLIPDHPLVIKDPDWYKILIPYQEGFLFEALNSAIQIFVQPVMDPDELTGPDAPSYRKALERCLQLCYENPRFVRMSLQLHKIIGIP